MFYKYFLASLLLISPITPLYSNPISGLSNGDKAYLGLFVASTVALHGYVMKKMTEEIPNISDKIAFGGIMTAGVLAIGYSLNYLADQTFGSNR